MAPSIAPAHLYGDTPSNPGFRENAKTRLNTRSAFKQSAHCITSIKDVTASSGKHARLLRRNRFEFSKPDGVGGYLSETLD